MNRYAKVLAVRSRPNAGQRRHSCKYRRARTPASICFNRLNDVWLPGLTLPPRTRGRTSPQEDAAGDHDPHEPDEG
jgi:hypothetical protein